MPSLTHAATRLAGVAVVGLAMALVAYNFHAPKAIGRPAPRDAGADGATDEAARRPYADGASTAAGDLDRPIQDRGSERWDAGAGTVMPDGMPVPPLPASVPKQVRFGVVLLSYSTAEASTAGGRVGTRTKAEAKVLAEKLHATALVDFHTAVQQGDAGSADDVGRVKLGLLEPAPEYVLFTLPVGGIGGPVDTPRGYWIVKRIE
jgi:hypothetical protein